MSERPPGLGSRAASNSYESAKGTRIYRWDLVVDTACQAPGAVARASVTTAQPPQDCPVPTLRATVTTGVTEDEVRLDAGTGQGSLEFTPRRTDLGTGPASFVVSLAAEVDSAGFSPHDDQCLDAQLQHLEISADFRAPAPG